MRVNNVNRTVNNQSFKGAMNNRVLLKGLEWVSNHGATFIAGTSALMAIGVKPLSIALTPKVDKKNKQYAATESIASGLIKFAMVEAIALPVEKALKNIDKEPVKYLTEKTIENLKEPAQKLIDSKNYKVLTQLIKQASGFVTAIPKSMFTIALIPVLMNFIFNNKNKKEQEKNYISPNKNVPKVFEDIHNRNKSNVAFKGGVNNLITKGISGVINNPKVQNLVKKVNLNETNIARNVSIATDLLITGSFVASTQKSKKIEKERKKPLILNHVISMGTFLACAYNADNLVQKGTKKLVEKFKEVNKNDVKLSKYIDGINIARSTLVFAVVYYAVLPIFSTFLAEKIDKATMKTKEK